MRTRRTLLSASALVLVLLVQYVFVTNDAVTGAFYTTDTGRLSPWPTLIPIPSTRFSSLVALGLGPLIRAFVYPAYLLCRITFSHSALNPDGLWASYLVTAMRSSRQEHLFLVQLALFNSAIWVLAWSGFQSAWRHFHRGARAA